MAYLSIWQLCQGVAAAEHVWHPASQELVVHRRPREQHKEAQHLCTHGSMLDLVAGISSCSLKQLTSSAWKRSQPTCVRAVSV